MRRQDDGFTLIELMVVVLIIGILMAIAIPTFLGSRSAAQQRSAQSMVRTAILTEASLATSTGGFADAVALNAAEPSLSFTDWSSPLSPAQGLGGNKLDDYVVSGNGTSTNDIAVLVALSADGRCYYGVTLADATNISGIPLPIGTYYSWNTGSGSTCPAAMGGSLPTFAHQPASTLPAGHWGTSF